MSVTKIDATPLDTKILHPGASPKTYTVTFTGLDGANVSSYKMKIADSKGGTEQASIAGVETDAGPPAVVTFTVTAANVANASPTQKTTWQFEIYYVPAGGAEGTDDVVWFAGEFVVEPRV